MKYKKHSSWRQAFRKSPRSHVRRRLRLFEQLEDRRLLTVWTVTKLTNDIIEDGLITLREAQRAASFNMQVGDAIAGSSDGPDEIRFAAELFANGPRTLTITPRALIGGDVDKNASLTIVGPGKDLLTIIAPNGAFDVSGTVTISGLTITGATTAPAINVSGDNATTFTLQDSRLTGNGHVSVQAGTSSDVTIQNSILTDNSERAIDAVGALVAVVDSEITNNTTATNGGGIHFVPSNLLLRGHLTVLRSLVSGNVAQGDGGGIYSQGSLNVLESTLDGNYSNGAGGAIYTGGINVVQRVSGSTLSNNSAQNGGGIFTGGNASDNTLVVDASTLSGNVATRSGGGIYNDGNGIQVGRSTLEGNSAGLHGGGIASLYNPANVYSTRVTATVSNTTISGNRAAGSGGGLYHEGRATSPMSPATLELINTTIVLNRADADNNGKGTGGGLTINDTGASNGPSTKMINTLVAGNLVGQNGVKTVDNGDTAFSIISGAWTQPAGNSDFKRFVGDDYLINSPGTGQDKVRWTFENLAPGKYRVLTSWASLGSATTATNAPFSVLDGGRLLQTVLVDQSEHPRRDLRYNGADFQSLGSYNITRGALVVELSDDANAAVLADAVQIQRVDDGSPASDLEVISASPNTINVAESFNNLIGDPGSAGGLNTASPNNRNIVGDSFGQPWNINRILFTNLTTALGGATAVHALKVDSPAIDAGTSAVLLENGGSLNSDQRGYPFLRADRQIGFTSTTTSPVDIGAFEVQARPTFTAQELVVSTLTDESDGDFSPGNLSLREAIEIANLRSDHNAIRFAGSILSTDPHSISTIVLDSPLPEITSNLTISGPGSQYLAISGGNTTHMLDVARLAELNLSGLKFTQGRGFISSVITNLGQTTIVDSVFEGNTSTDRESAVIYNVGVLQVRDSSMTNNVGSALKNRRDYVAGIVSGAANVVLGPHVEIANNSYPNGIGAIFVRNGVVTLLDTTVSGNTYGEAGGLKIVFGDVTIRRSTIANNVANANNVPNNGNGGGIHNVAGSLELVDTTIDGNYASGDGGGIFEESGHPVAITRSTISNNVVGGSGGGVYTAGGGAMLIRSSTLSANRSNSQGGGIFHLNGALTVESATITRNEASVSGGGAQISLSQFKSLSNSIIAGNRLSNSSTPSDLFFGGGVCGTGTATENLVVDVIVTNNCANVDFSTGNNSGNIVDANGNEYQLGPLQDNGGFTATHHLQPTSIAIDSGSREGLLDQRGFPITDNDFSETRPPGTMTLNGFKLADDIADIGAYESAEVVLERFQAQIRDASQFGEGPAVVIGQGFDLGRPLCEDVAPGTICTTVPKEPGFIGLEFDPRPFTIGPGIGEGLLGDLWGGEATVDLDGRAGLEYGYYVNSGSVDTFYDGLFGYTIDETTTPGEIVIATGVAITDGSLFTVSPRVGAYVDLVFEFNASVQVEACVIWCADGKFGIKIDETLPLLSLNRQRKDANGNSLFIDPAGSLTSNSKDGANPPAFDGEIVFVGTSLNDLSVDFPPDDDDDKALEGTANYIAEQREARRKAEIDNAKGIGDKTKNDAIIRKANDNEKRASSNGGNQKTCSGGGITLSFSEADGDLLGADVEVAKGACFGGIEASKSLGKLSVTIPDIQLSDTEADSQGRLTASTDDFLPGSLQDAKRKLLALTVDVAAIGPLGKYSFALGPLSAEATTVSYEITPRLALSQDVKVEPFFDVNHQATFRFNGFSGTIVVIIGDTRHNAVTAGTAFSFLPGEVVTVINGGKPVDIVPTIKVGNRFSNDMGIDLDIKGVLEILSLQLNAFGEEIFGIGPLIRDEHSLLDSFDLGSIFSETFNLPATDTVLKTFTVGGANTVNARLDGTTPGNAFRLTSGRATSFDSVAAGQLTYFSVPLVDHNGAIQTKVLFETPSTGAQVSFIRPPYAGMTLELLNGNTVVSSFDLPIEGKDPRGINGWTGHTWRLGDFENLLGGQAIFGVEFDSGAAQDITASTTVGEALTPEGVNTARVLNSARQRDAELNSNAYAVDNDFAFDIDNDGVISVTTDGTLVTRYINSIQPGGPAFTIDGAVGVGAKRTDFAEILAYLRGLEAAPDQLRYDFLGATELEVLAYRDGLKDGRRLDVDDSATFDVNGNMTHHGIDPGIDGVIILRHMSGIGASNTSAQGLVDGITLPGSARRTHPRDMAEFIDGKRGFEVDSSFNGQILSRSPRGEAGKFKVLDTAVVGSSPWNPFESGFVQGQGSYALSTFRQPTAFDDIYIIRGTDTLVRTGASGTPGRTFAPDPSLAASYLTNPLSPDIRAFETRIDTTTRTLGVDADAPIFVKLPDAAGYLLNLPAGFTFSRIDIDSAVGGNSFLDHPGNGVDFDLFVPSTGDWFEVSMDTPLGLPGGVNALELYPRGLRNPALHDAANRGVIDLDLQIGFVLTGPTSPAPVLDVTVLTDRQAPIDIDDIYSQTSGGSEFRLIRNGAYLDLAIDGQPAPITSRQDLSLAVSVDNQPARIVDNTSPDFRIVSGAWRTGRTSIPSPTVLWRFDERSGTTAADAIGDRDAEYHGVQLSKPGAARNTGTAIEFDGTDDYATASLSTNELSGQEYSVSGWFKADSARDQMIFEAVSKRGSRAGFGLQLLSERRLVLFEDYVGTNSALTIDGRFLPDTWHHFVVTRGSSALRLYLDGTLQATVAPNGTINESLNIQFGQNRDGALKFQGQLDEVAVFNTALDATHVRELFTADTRGFDGNHVTINDPQADWSLGSQVPGAPKNFNGVDDYFATSLSSDQLSGQDYSVSLWYMTDKTGTQTLFAATNPDNNHGHAILLELSSDGTYRFLNRLPTGTTGGNDMRVGSYEPGFWHHLVAVRNGADMFLYEDAALVGQLDSVSGLIDFAADVTVGRLSPVQSSRHFDGKMDAVSVYNKALTPEEVRALFVSQSRGFDAQYLVTDNGTAEWTFENLEPGRYQVAATWADSPARGKPPRYIIRDGSGVTLGSRSISQDSPPTANVVVDGVNFEFLRTVTLTTESLTVRLQGTNLSADAVRIKRVDLTPIKATVVEGFEPNGPRLRLDMASPNMAGFAHVTMTVTNEEGVAATDTFQVTLTDTPPISSAVAPIADIRVPVGTAQHVIDLSGIFAESNLTFFAVSDNADVTTSVVGNNLTVTLLKEEAATITVSARDAGNSLVGTDTFSITIGEPNADGPVILKPIADMAFPLGTTAKLINILGNYTQRTDFSLASIVAGASTSRYEKPLRIVGQDNLADTLILDGTGGPLYQPFVFEDRGGNSDKVSDASEIRVVGNGMLIDLVNRDIVRNVGIIDLRGTGSNTLIIDRHSVTQGKPQRMVVIADADDTVTIDDRSVWTLDPTPRMDTRFPFPFDVYSRFSTQLWVSVPASTPAATPNPGPAPSNYAPSTLDRELIDISKLPAQVVMIPPDNTTVGLGQEFNLDVGYHVTDASPGIPPGILIEVHYDSDFLRFNQMTLPVTTAGGFVPSITAQSVEDIEAVPDGDLRTDRVVVLAWSEFLDSLSPDGTTWPADVSLNELMATLNFQAQGETGVTNIRITGLSAAGYQFDSASLEINIRSGLSTIQLPIGETRVTNESGLIVFRNNGSVLFQESRENITELVIQGGDGDETFAVGELGLVDGQRIHLRFDGRGGHDTVRLLGENHSLDFTTPGDVVLQNIQSIDITGSGANSLTLNAAEVLNISPETGTLRVQHDDGDTVNYGAGWSLRTPQIVGGQFVHVLQQDGATVEVANTRAFQNPLRAVDANHDGSVSPVDVLVIINRLNRTGGGELQTPVSLDGGAGFFYFDVNGDGIVSPIDVLLVINFLNNASFNAEGETVVPHFDHDTRATINPASAVTVSESVRRQAIAQVVGPPTLSESPTNFRGRLPDRMPNTIKPKEDDLKEDDLIAAIDAFFTNFQTSLRPESWLTQ